MSIHLRFYTFIIPKMVIHEKYLGGLENFLNNSPNNSFQEDEHLVSFGFMNMGDVQIYSKNLREDGLNYNEETSTDFTVISQFSGALWDVNWLDRDHYHCWLRNSLPTHTNLFTPQFKVHKVLVETTENAIWWNQLNDAWKNIFYHNYKVDEKEKPEKLHNIFSFGYKMKFIGHLTISDIDNLLNIDEIWCNAISCKDLGKISDLTTLSKFKNLKRLTLKHTSLKSLNGIENLENLEFIEIGGHFSDLKLISTLSKLQTLNLNSKMIDSIKTLNNLNLNWLNINNGKIPLPEEFEDFKKTNPNCIVYIS